MMKMFRKAERVMADVVDPEEPVHMITTEEQQNPASFGDDISIPNLVRQNAPRHLEKLGKERDLLLKKVQKIDAEMKELNMLLGSLTNN